MKTVFRFNRPLIGKAALLILGVSWICASRFTWDWATLAALPIVGMAVSKMPPIDGWDLSEFQGKEAKPVARVPLRRWFRLTPLLCLEFLMLTFHTMGLSMIVDFWMDVHVADAPVIGWVIDRIAPDLVFGELIVFIVALYIVMAPILLTWVAMETGALARGLKGLQQDEMAMVTLGVPAFFFLVAVLVEAYGLYFRIVAEQVEQDILDAIGVDPAIPLIVIITAISLAITSMVGFITAKIARNIKRSV